MSAIPRCVVCDAPVSPYGGEAVCKRCSLPCPTCGGVTGFCRHPLRGDLGLTETRGDPLLAKNRRTA